MQYITDSSLFNLEKQQENFFQYWLLAEVFQKKCQQFTGRFGPATWLASTSPKTMTASEPHLSISGQLNIFKVELQCFNT